MLVSFVLGHCTKLEGQEASFLVSPCNLYGALQGQFGRIRVLPDYFHLWYVIYSGSYNNPWHLQPAPYLNFNIPSSLSCWNAELRQCCLLIMWFSLRVIVFYIINDRTNLHVCTMLTGMSRARPSVSMIDWCCFRRYAVITPVNRLLQ